MNNLKKEAEGLGIEVDARWSDETLKQKIAEAKANSSGATQGEKEELFPIRLLVDWWDDQENRHVSGAEVDVPWTEAKKLIDEGKAERADAFTPKQG